MLRRGDTIVRKYRLEEWIGRGSFGEVWKAQDLLADRVVALKVVPAEDYLVALLLDEAKVWSKLKHPNIVEFITAEVEPDGSAVYFAMEFMEEGSLAQALKRHGPLSPERVESIAHDVLFVLEYTHEQAPGAPILHRDIKPPNLFFTKEGRVKVGDWGLARRIRKGSGARSRSGTGDYAAPEIYKGRKYDHRVDLYALGVTLYELLKGELPFTGSDEQIMLGHLEGEPAGGRALCGCSESIAVRVWHEAA